MLAVPTRVFVVVQGKLSRKKVDDFVLDKGKRRGGVRIVLGVDDPEDLPGHIGFGN
jgi:hypothetical protein